MRLVLKGGQLFNHLEGHRTLEHYRHSLRRIETAMQRMELASLSALSGNQRSLVTNGQPVIAEIAVTEVAAADKRPPAEKE